MTNLRHSLTRPRPVGRGGASPGFGLIEVMFALTFLAVGILAIASLAPMGTRGITRSKTLTSGFMAAQVKLEDLKSMDFDMSLTGFDLNGRVIE